MEIVTSTNSRVMLSSLWRERPLLLTMFYGSCTGTCSPFLHALKQAIDETGGNEGYNVLTLSFDPKDTPEDMRNREASLGIQATDRWIFATSSPASISRLAEAVGYWYRYDRDRGKFDHPSQITALRNGRVYGTMFGPTVPKKDFRTLLLEAKGIFVPIYPRPGKEALIRCFAVDELTGETRLDWGLLLLLFPGCGAVVATAYVFGRDTSGQRRL